MNISAINSIAIHNNYKKGIDFKNEATPFVGCQQPSYNTYSSENVKANFMPSFAKAKKIGQVMLIEKDTGRAVAADLKRDTRDSIVTYSVNVGRKGLGSISMDCDSIYPFFQHITSFPTNNIPKVISFSTLEDCEYVGVNSALVSAAVSESRTNLCYGNLWLNAGKNYNKSDNPIPFYYKMGFVSPEINQHNRIIDCIAREEYKELPDNAILILPTTAGFMPQKTTGNDKHAS